MVGYDLDGVIAVEWGWLSRVDRIGYLLFGHWWGYIRYPWICVMYQPKGPFVIITSRHVKLRRLTERWLTRKGIWPSMVEFYNGNVFTPEAFARYKAEAIERLGLVSYYENDIVVAGILKNMLPNVQIILVRRKSWTQ